MTINKEYALYQENDETLMFKYWVLISDNFKKYTDIFSSGLSVVKAAKGNSGYLTEENLKWLKEDCTFVSYFDSVEDAINCCNTLLLLED